MKNNVQWGLIMNRGSEPLRAVDGLRIDELHGGGHSKSKKVRGASKRRNTPYKKRSVSTKKRAKSTKKKSSKCTCPHSHD